MKKSWSILFIGLFLVTSLYSAQILQSSYASSATLTEPNMTKDFAPSIDYTSSPQSLTSFAETLSNNVLFYPDGTQLEKDESPYNGGIYYFEAGDLDGTCYLDVTSDFDGDYDALILNGDGLDGMGTGGGVVSNGFPLRFNLNVTISSYSEGAGSEMYLRLVAFSGIALGGEENYFAQEDIDTDGNLIIDAECGLSSVGSMLIMVDFSGFSFEDTVNVTCNSYYFYTMSGSGYLENFVDVSDWTVTDGTITTDGDVANITRTSGGYACAVYDFGGDMDFTNYYIECLISGGVEQWLIQLRGIGGTPTLYTSLWQTGTGQFKEIIANGTDVNEIWVFVDDSQAVGYEWVTFDYLRISQSDEMGYQHDMSTTTGLTGIVESDYVFGYQGGGVGSSSGTYADTLVNDGSWFSYHSSPNFASAYVDFNLTEYSGIEKISFFVNMKLTSTNSLTSGSGVWLYDWDITTDTQVYEYTSNGIETFYNSSTTDSDYWDSGYFRISAYAVDQVDTSTLYSYIDYVSIIITEEAILSPDSNTITFTDSLILDTDITATQALIDTSYYPFLDLFVIDGVGNVLVEVSDNGTDWSTVVSSTPIAEITHYRGNVLSLGIDIKNIRVNVSSWATVDYCQLYGIANYEYLQGGAITTNDFFYVDSGTLYCENDNADYIGLLLDPVMSVTDTYTLWNITTPTGLGNEFSFRVYVTPDWTSFNDEETNGTLPTGTVTDMAFYAYNDVTISAIKFLGIGPQWMIIDSINLIFDTKGWYTIDTIILYFYTGTWDWGINIFLIFLGLVMIPLSSIYLVKGGRDEMSMDKVFFATVVFILGWAFFLGGIFV